MKKIAIFVSGEGKAAERVVKLFNEGNRVKTVIIVTDDSASDLSERLKGEEVTIIAIPDEQWHERSLEVAEAIKQQDVSLIVLDGFDKSISDEIMETVEGEVIRVTSPEQAPREVVAALEKDLRKPVEEIKVEEKENETPTLESEWADALKINFTPPPVPSFENREPSPEYQVPSSESQVPGVDSEPTFQHGFNPRPQPPIPNHQYPHSDTPPMPSTWLIWSILATVFCCFIPGIIAIIFSSQVSSKYYAGDIEGSRRASRNAEAWIIVSVVLGVLAATLYLPFMLISS